MWWRLTRSIAYVIGIHVLLTAQTVSVAQTPSNANQRIVSSHFELMGTFVDVRVAVCDGRVSDAQAAIQRARGDLETLVRIASSWDTDSDTSKINSSAGIAPVKVRKDLVDILLCAKRVSQMSGGAFDVTFAPVGRLWNLRSPNPTIPSKLVIEQQLRLVGYTDLIVDRRACTVFLKKVDMRIDLGGIAKGAVIDAGVRSLRTSGIENALVNAGGDIYAMGAKGEDAWMVGITNPCDKDGPVIGKMALRDQAVATSGDYEKMAIIDGKRYHHILDPRTGWPADKCISVTVVAANAQVADALATAVFVLGPENGIALCERLENVEAAVITPDFEVVYSRGFPSVIERKMLR